MQDDPVGRDGPPRALVTEDELLVAMDLENRFEVVPVAWTDLVGC